MFVLGLLLASLEFDDPSSPAEKSPPAFVGTYTAGTASRGIYRIDRNPNTTRESAVSAMAAEGENQGIVNPSFVVVRGPGGPFIYAVEEVESFQGNRTGAVAALRFEPSSGTLRKLNEQSSGGAGPCHIILDREGKHVLVANYAGGSVAVLPIDADGKLQPPSSVVRHTGRGVNPERQEGPHAHAVVLSPDGRYAVVADLGLDRLMVYAFDAQRGTLRPHEPAFIALDPGAGPRHLAFHPGGKFAYVNNEMASTITALHYDAARGAFATIQTLSTLPDDFRGSSSTAEIAIHPTGRFVYVSNRGHDSIASYAIDAATGRLKPIAFTPTGGRTPRGFAIDPSGTRLLAANQDSDNVVEFRIDTETGALTPTGVVYQVPKPVCVAF